MRRAGKTGPITKAEAKRRAMATWWERGPWPMVVLTIDSGAKAGATIARCHPDEGIEIIRCRGIDTYAREGVEETVWYAVAAAESFGLPLVAVLEDWGAGGPRGLKEWVGLGETRGPWRRWLTIASKETDVLTLKRIVKVPQSRWRSRVIPETGVPKGKEHPKTGKLVWRSFDTDEWKRAAQRAAADYFIDTAVPDNPDAAESLCMVIYAARCDEVLKAFTSKHKETKALVSRHLKRYEIPPEHMVMLDPIIRGK